MDAVEEGAIATAGFEEPSCLSQSPEASVLMTPLPTDGEKPADKFNVVSTDAIGETGTAEGHFPPLLAIKSDDS